MVNEKLDYFRIIFLIFDLKILYINLNNFGENKIKMWKIFFVKFIIFANFFKLNNKKNV